MGRFSFGVVPLGVSAGIELNSKEDNWQRELAQTVRSYSELERCLGLRLPRPATDYPQPLFIPRRLIEPIKRGGPDSALWRQFVPHADEFDEKLCSVGLDDPIGDQDFARGSSLVHRYKNRALWMPTSICPVQCRYCFRKNELHQKAWPSLDFKKDLTYLATHPEIEEVIFSGGDPLILSNRKLAQTTDALVGIQAIKRLRFHTRTPIVLPSRMETRLLRFLETLASRFTVSLVVHCNHLAEIDREVECALKALRPLPIHVMSQSVLLKGVNDNPSDLVALFCGLSDMGVRPYYLHHPDRVRGGMHFYLTLERGRQIYEAVKNNLAGWMLPRYVVDLPDGEGKALACNPETFDFSGGLRGRSGRTVSYPQQN